MDVLECLRIKEMQQASFVALCQIFAADQSKYDDFITIVPDLIKNLNISESFGLQCIERYFSEPKYVFDSSEQQYLVKQEDCDELVILNKDINFFIPQDTEKQRLFNRKGIFWDLPELPEGNVSDKIMDIWGKIYDTLPSLEKPKVDINELNKLTSDIINEILQLI